MASEAIQITLSLALTYAAAHHVDASEVILRVCLALAAGGLVGLEREYTAKAAGLRTHTLVCLGACLYTLAGVVTAGTDPTRTAAQVVSGIGFLGAGAILHTGPLVRGLTTAASLWVSCA